MNQMMKEHVSLGLDTFGDVSRGADGQLKKADGSGAARCRGTGRGGRSGGIDFIGLGEHHRDDFAVSAPRDRAGRNRRAHHAHPAWHGGDGASSDDPVRVFQRFSTLNAVSNGRAEAILGRGSFTESYALFGYDLQEYEQLFEEKLDLFVRLLREAEVTWQGQTRSPLKRQRVYPPLGPGGLTTWVGVGGSPESVVRVVRQTCN